MGEIQQKVLNGTAKLIAMKKDVSNNEITGLIETVMNYMLNTGTKRIDLENLIVNIDLSGAKVEKFEINDSVRNTIDLKGHTYKFNRQILMNQVNGLKRLTEDVIENEIVIHAPKIMNFGKN